MSLQGDCFLFNRLGTDAQIISSEIGANGAWTGTHTYQANKFDNGSYSNSASNYILIPDTSFNQDNFCLEFWLKFDWNSIPIGNRYWLWWQPDASNLIGMGYETSGNIVIYYRANSAGGGLNINIPTAISSGNLYHFEFVGNRTGIDGGADTRRVYWNKSLVHSSTTALNASTAIAGNFKLLNHSTTGGAMFGSMDNFKGYTNSDIFQEALDNNNNEFWPSGVADLSQAIII